MAFDVPISEDEYRGRRERLAEQLRSKDLDGAIIWARGGAANVNSYGDVMYFTNHFSFIPPMQDSSLWTGRGGNALIMRADGTSTLVADIFAEDGSVYADKIICAERKSEGVVAALKELDLLDKRLGLAGENEILHKDYVGLCAAAGKQLEFTALDELIENMRAIKSPRELELMRRSAEVYSEAMAVMMEAAQPGRTEGDVVGEGLRVLAQNGARVYDVAVASGSSSGHYTGDTVPSWNSERPLENGDLIHIDAWGPTHSYHADMMRSTVVGGQPTEEQAKLLQAPIDMIYAMIGGVRPGATFADIYSRGLDWLSKADIEAERDWGDEDVGDLFPAFGHCIGLSIEGPWITPEEKRPLQEGMVLAIEGTLNNGPLGVGFEESMIVTGDGCEIISKVPIRPWEV